MKKIFCLFALLIFIQISNHAQMIERPILHFTPEKGWMNDPNGLIYKDGIYHMFYQYYPDKTVWGPMHWGHAESKDLIHWDRKPIALYPDSLGYIFSGSAVVDKENTAGFGRNALVAIYTNHNIALEQEKSDKYQYQSIAYSTDNGVSWTKYAKNPVLENPGISDFRDPNVIWYEAGKKWIMSLATKDCISFYASTNLKEWKKESSFGQNLGNHGGVWECPDLISFEKNGKKLWALLVSINPGGPNQGSATQYFIGNFDGHTFKETETEEKWIDWGTDNYAGVTWHNLGSKNIFIGWMSNWLYGQEVPATTWRSTMTIPRELSLENVNGKYYLASKPIKAFTKNKPILSQKAKLQLTQNIPYKWDISTSKGIVSIDLNKIKAEDFAFEISNQKQEKLIFGYLKSENKFYIDRSPSGETSFNVDFKKRIFAPRISKKEYINLSIILDKTSIEVFADDGISVLTSIFFPHTEMDTITLKSSITQTIENLKIVNLNGKYIQ